MSNLVSGQERWISSSQAHNVCGFQQAVALTMCVGTETTSTCMYMYKKGRPGSTLHCVKTYILYHLKRTQKCAREGYIRVRLQAQFVSILDAELSSTRVGSREKLTTTIMSASTRDKESTVTIVSTAINGDSYRVRAPAELSASAAVVESGDDESETITLVTTSGDYVFCKFTTPLQETCTSASAELVC